MFNKKKFFIEIKKKLHNKEIPRMNLNNSIIAEKSIITLPSGLDVFKK